MTAIPGQLIHIFQWDEKEITEFLQCFKPNSTHHIFSLLISRDDPAGIEQVVKLFSIKLRRSNIVLLTSIWGILPP